MKYFHVTLTQGRSDSIECQADSKSDILNFFNTVSTAIVSSIKHVVYSKTKKINFTKSILPSKEKAYNRVEVFCRSKTYAKIFTLYHVPLSVTKEVLVSNFKKLLIVDEEIIDVFNVVFFDDIEGVARDSNNSYQLLYKINSKTHHIELQAKDSQTVIDFFTNVLQRDLEEVRHHQHKDTRTKIDDGDYVKYKSCFIKNKQNEISTIKVPKVKKSINDIEFDKLVLNTFYIGSQKVNSLSVTTKF